MMLRHFALMIAIATALAACAKKRPNRPTPLSLMKKDEPPQPEPASPESKIKNELKTLNLNTVIPQAGVKNFEQLVRSMAEVTKMDRASPTLNDTIAENKGQCPTNHNPGSLSGATVACIYKLATGFCSLYIDQLSLTNQIQGFDFKAPIATAFADPARDALVLFLFEDLWGGARTSIPKLDFLQKELAALTEEILKVVDLSRADIVPGVTKGLCVPVLAGAPVTTN